LKNWTELEKEERVLETYRIMLFTQMNLLISKVSDQNALMHVNSR